MPYKVIFFSFLIIFTLVSAFCSLALISLFSLSSIEVRLYKEDKDRRKRLAAQLLAHPRELLITLLFCDILANILVQNMAANFFGEYSGWSRKVGVPLLITLLFGEIFPKTIGLANNKKIAYRIAPIVAYLAKVLGPFSRVVTGFISSLSRIIFFFLKKEKEISYEELHLVLRQSEGYGILNRDEAELIDGYLSLKDYSVKERMRPRHEMLYYDVEEPLTRLIHLFADEECSQVPVCKGDLENLQGILSSVEFFKHRNEIDEGNDVLKYLKKPFYVPESIFARTPLRQFLATQQSMGIVVDEYGSVTGLITQEDLYEVVIGEIIDRREKTRYTTVDKDVIIASGKFDLSEFEELFSVALPTENSQVTLGGWLTEQLGDIPKSGTKFVWKNFLFQVLAADPNRVRRIYIRRLPPERSKS